ncbi:hypothetical protein H2200_012830 [Cladophialophora chaetospira]|uniref:Uncharacterized protein n=1 Tax=Cladophialophora chaetospira TaxID=386627 RepID=A0AA38WWY5_9EURO|nr:hypothetical protein H2200_012830 [Cladophialophora chaetospira]
MASLTRLSEHDGAVLGAILEPESGLGNGPLVVQANIDDGVFYDVHRLRTIRQREKEILYTLNSTSPSREDVESSIQAFDMLLQRSPEYASGYNNRAQARRLLFPSLEALAKHPDAIVAILQDLTKAISLESPAGSAQSISPEAASVLSSAYTHRGYLFYSASQMETLSYHSFTSVPYLADRDSGELLEMSSRDFALGGRYGNKAAKQLAVYTNPYAKLCGTIVKEALHREFEPSARSV